MRLFFFGFVGAKLPTPRVTFCRLPFPDTPIGARAEFPSDVILL
jgi:hypothetical protein